MRPEMRDETIALHAGYETEPTTRAVAVPVYQTVAYEFESADHGAALFNLEVPGHIYGRLSNPTTAVLERRIALLEGGREALCVGSGAAAIHCALANLVEAGDNFVTFPELYGATFTLFAHVFRRQGVEARFADIGDPNSIVRHIDARTRAVYCETVANPSGRIADIAALADIAHAHGLPLIVDNTLASPVLCKPIRHGADVVVHSLTKYIGGHGTTLGGAIVDGGTFPWSTHRERFPMFTRPEAAYHGVIYTVQYGETAYVARCRTVGVRNTGPVLAPLGAFLILQGLETLSLRVERQVENAARIAAHLRAHPKVAWVQHTGLADDGQRALVKKYLSGRGCAFLTFGVKGGFEAGKILHDALKLFKRLVNIGDARSLVCHPASTTHRQLTDQQLLRAGVRPEMIRLSIGIEHIDDILADLNQALAEV